ncbi:dTDP-4-dehydrorhamnose reductase [Aeromonas veronii]|uniref:dTDP-4-dehydrorhamnose reductase n=1 Tax=Aeromonas veronii TaxID=654 RepID=UPI0005C14EF5|nr:dTDP-4-dehydrorhamnose reductase [Aeromonas veronii]
MRILLLGARGQLGRALFSALSREFPHWQVNALGREECDITIPAVLCSWIDACRPDVIINCAAYTAVDEAESEQELADMANHQALLCMAREARNAGALLVHFSTDYVFDGTGTRPWLETDQPRPLNVYGMSKYAGELAIQRLCSHHLIIRTGWLYGGEGRHFARTILARATQGQALAVVDDQWGAPTRVDWLARASVLALSQVLHSPNKAGLYHLLCRGETSWHGFASDLVSEAYRLGKLKDQVSIRAICSDEWPQQALRPLNSRLDSHRFSSVFGLELPSWQEHMNAWLTEVNMLDMNNI